MAKYRCPSCGESFNGKKCRACFYEAFGEVTPRFFHDPDMDSRPMELPKTSPPRPKQRKPVRRQKKTEGPLIWLLILLFLNPILSVVGLVVGQVAEVGSELVSLTAEPEPVPEAVISDRMEELYSDSQFTLYGDWEQLKIFGEDSIIVENHTDWDLTFTARQIQINDFLSENSSLSCSVPAGSRMEGQLRLSQEDRALAGISEIGMVSLQLTAYDMDSYETMLEDIPLTLPEGDSVFLTTPEPEGKPVLEDDSLRIRFLGYVPDEWSPEELIEGELLFYLENTSDHDLTVYTYDCLLNGSSVSISLYCELPPRTKTITRVYLYGAEEVGVTALEDIRSFEMTLEAYDPDDPDFFLSPEPFSLSME